jgi:hypothetical protein
LGAAVALVSGVISGLIVGIVVARYQARRTAELTERLRRLERRDQREEEALVELEPILPTRGQIDHFRSALDSDSGSAMAGAWIQISNALQSLEKAWTGGLSAKVSAPEIRSAVDSLLGVRTWYERRLARRDEDGTPVLAPEGVDNLERFRRAGQQEVARLDGLLRMVDKRLRHY